MKCLILLQMFSIFCSSFLVHKVHSSAEGASYFFYEQPAYPRDCQEVFEQCSTTNASGVYLIKPDGYNEAFEVYCDNHLDGGGWTVFQRRNENNTVGFRRNFSEYDEGFGFLSDEFWLGNDKLSFLSNQKRYHLRIDMTNAAGSSFYVTYDLFRISDDWSNYQLTNVGRYDGTAGSFISQCPANTIFGPCACQGTCADPDGCHKSCTVEETCVCPAPGFLLSGSDCVPRDRCGCYDQTFGAIPCDVNAVCEERNNVRKCYCNEGYTGDGQNCTETYTDCYEVFTSRLPDGVYTIQPTGWTEKPFEVYCNMSHGGGWTVLQRRVDNSLSFYNSWAGYKRGFGKAGRNENIWLGNDKLYYITKQKAYKLRIDVVNEDLVDWHMNYDLFRVNNESSNYSLELGNFSGNTGYDYMSDHRGRPFSTPDCDNSYGGTHCGRRNSAGWWYKDCFTANLNGDALRGGGFALYNRDYGTSHKNLRYSQMKTRPI